MRTTALAWVLCAIAATSCRHTLPRFSNDTTLPGDYQGTLEHGEHTRSFHVHVPPAYDGTRALPLVLALHGALGNATNNEQMVRWYPKADAEGFLVVEPEGLSPAIPLVKLGVWNAGSCCGYAKSHDIDDVGFLRQVIDDVSSKLRVDPARVFATGFSNGGAMAHRLACELSDRIAAIAPVSGLLLNVDLEEREVRFECKPQRPVPVFEIHGAKDRIALYGGGRSTCLWGSPNMPSATQTIAGWAERNGCGESTRETYAAPGASCSSYDACRADTVLCTVEHLGHAWPGGKRAPFPCLAPWSDAFDATGEIWKFFTAHPMGRATSGT
jgi:polyhydroxybutyrate depolymerase